eukprot:1923780-Pyramimonas_sp.AAC.1
MELQVPHGHALVDVQSFYDSVEWPQLARAALQLKFPPVILFLELQICLSPRLIAQLSSYSLPFQPASPVVQGLRSGTIFA